MVRSRRHRGAWAIAAVMAAGLLRADVAIADNWTVAAYVAGRSDLEGPSRRYVERLSEGARACGHRLVLQWCRDDGAERRVVAWGEEVVKSEVGVEAGIADFMAWAGRVAGSDRVLMIVFGHGALPTESAGVAGGMTVGAVVNGPGGLSAREVARACARWRAAGGRRVDVLALDCCYAGNADVLWELRDAAEVIVASPGRVASNGIAWETVLPAASADGALTSEALAAACASRRTEGTWGAHRCGSMREIAAAAAELAARLSARIEVSAPLVTAAASRCESWGPDRELCDLSGLARELSGVEDAEIATAAGRLVEAMSRGREGDGRRGAMAVVLPRGLSDAAERYGSDEKGFAAVSGWAEFTHLYTRRLQDLMNRVTESRRVGDEAS